MGKEQRADFMDNESIIMENEDSLNTDSTENESDVYPINNLRVEKNAYSIFELKRKYDNLNSTIILDSSFQRNNVWKTKQKAELVESVLMGLPLPVFYFNQDKYGRLIVIDGRQRLTSLFEYLNNGFSLEGLHILHDLEGKNFSELTPVQKSRIEDYQIQAYVIMPPTPDRIKFDIFDRVNRGGTKLNKQEIRNALYQGNASELLNVLVQSECFAKATGNAFKTDVRMKNKYVVLRFLSLYMIKKGKLGNDEPKFLWLYSFDDILGKCMETINNLSNRDCEELKNVTERALNNSFIYLGEDAFRLSTAKGQSRKTPINMNVFELIMLILSDLDDNDLRGSNVTDLIFELIRSKDFLENISYHRDGSANIKWRMDAARMIESRIGQK